MARRDVEARRLPGAMGRGAARYLAVEQRVGAEILDQLERERSVRAGDEALGPYAAKLAVGGFVLPFFFLFNPGLTMQGGIGAIAPALVFGAALVTFGSFALQGWLGPRRIGVLERLLLIAAGVACIVPRLEIQLGALALGTLTLLAVKWLKAPVVAAAPAEARRE